MSRSDILRQKYFFLSICIICIIIQVNCNQIKRRLLSHDTENKLGVSGHLYDIFRKNIENFGKELGISYAIDNTKLSLVHQDKIEGPVNADNFNKIATVSDSHKMIDKIKVVAENKHRVDDFSDINKIFNTNVVRDDINDKENTFNTNYLSSENVDMLDEVNVSSDERQNYSNDAALNVEVPVEKKNKLPNEQVMSENKNESKSENMDEFKDFMWNKLNNKGNKTKEYLSAGNFEGSSTNKSIDVENKNEFKSENKDEFKDFMLNKLNNLSSESSANKSIDVKNKNESKFENKDEFKDFILNNINNKEGVFNHIVKAIIDKFEDDITNQTLENLSPKENKIIPNDIGNDTEFIDQLKSTIINRNNSKKSDISAISVDTSDSDELEKNFLNNMNEIFVEENNKVNIIESINKKNNNVSNEMLTLYKKDFVSEKKNGNEFEERNSIELADEILKKYNDSAAYKENKAIEEKSKEVVKEIIDIFEQYKKQKGLKDSAADQENNIIKVVPNSISGSYGVFKKSDDSYGVGNLKKLPEVFGKHNSKLNVKTRKSIKMLLDKILARRYLQSYISDVLKTHKKRRYGDKFLCNRKTLSLSHLQNSQKLLKKRRQVPNKVASSSSAVQSSFSRDAKRESFLGALTSENMLSNIAKEMNMTNLETAKKLTALGDLSPENLKNEPKLNKILHTHIGKTMNVVKDAKRVPPVNSNSSNIVANNKHKDEEAECEEVLENTQVQHSLESTTPKPNKITNQSKEKSQTTTSDKTISSTELDTNDEQTCEENNDEISSSIMAVLDKVLKQLERIRSNDEEEDESECSAEGTPCNLGGLWNSHALGIAFEISVITHASGTTRKLSPTEKGNLLLNITPKECDPPKNHQKVIDLEWTFMGSSLKELGGPFYMYTQPHCGNRLATFVGYCRVCSGIDTIFGSWAFVSPSSDCQNILSSFENKIDVMRRNSMEAKRVDRYKNMLFEQKFSNKKMTSD